MKSEGRREIEKKRSIDTSVRIGEIIAKIIVQHRVIDYGFESFSHRFSLHCSVPHMLHTLPLFHETISDFSSEKLFQAMPSVTGELAKSRFAIAILSTGRVRDRCRDLARDGCRLRDVSLCYGYNRPCCKNAYVPFLRYLSRNH